MLNQSNNLLIISKRSTLKHVQSELLTSQCVAAVDLLVLLVCVHFNKLL